LIGLQATLLQSFAGSILNNETKAGRVDIQSAGRNQLILRNKKAARMGRPEKVSGPDQPK
jgi:hypothetical protein